MTDDERLRLIEGFKAEREAAGRAEFVQSPVVYRLLAACLDAQTEEQTATKD